MPLANLDRCEVAPLGEWGTRRGLVDCHDPRSTGFLRGSRAAPPQESGELRGDSIDPVGEAAQIESELPGSGGIAHVAAGVGDRVAEVDPDARASVLGGQERPGFERAVRELVSVSSLRFGEWAGRGFAGRLRSRPGEQSRLGLGQDSAPGQALQFDADVVEVVLAISRIS